MKTFKEIYESGSVLFALKTNKRFNDNIEDKLGPVRHMQINNDGNVFVVTDRKIKGKSQDKFSMAIVDRYGEIVDDLGSHPSLKGAQKFGERFK